MTSAHDGAHTPGSPGGRTAAGASPEGDAGWTSDGPEHPVGSHAVGSHAAGSHAAGTHAVGSHAVGSDPAGSQGVGPQGLGPETSTLHDVDEAAAELEAEVEDRPPPAGTTANTVIAVLVVALGAAALVGSLSLGAGSAGNPGSGTWPTVLSILIVVLGVALAVTARGTTDAERFSRSSWLVLAGLATMVGFVAVIDVIGFEIPAGLLAFVWLRFLGGESWRTSVITSIAVVIAFYLVFVAALSVPIPHLF